MPVRATDQRSLLYALIKVFMWSCCGENPENLEKSCTNPRHVSHAELETRP